MTIEPFTIRPLGYGDLPQVIAIERRAFPTPWSLAMFVLELSKPSSICLAAVHDEKAREFLTAAQHAPLLPEEKKLIDKAFASLESWRRIR